VGRHAAALSARKTSMVMFKTASSGKTTIVRRAVALARGTLFVTLVALPVQLAQAAVSENVAALVAVSGAEDSTRPDETGVAVLDQTIVGFAANDEPLEEVLRRLQQGEPDFAICLEHEIAVDPAVGASDSVSVGPIETATMAEVLDAVTAAAEPGDFYTWYESPIKKGVVHILPRDPKERFACLDVIIPHFRVENVLYYEAFFALFEQPELAGITPGASIRGPDYRRISLDLVNVTVRDALTHIVLAAKSGMGWQVTGYVQEPPVPRFAFGRFGTSLRPDEDRYNVRFQQEFYSIRPSGG